MLAVFPALCPIIGCIIRVFRRLACQSVTSHRLDTTHPCTCTTFCFEALSLSWLLFHNIASFLFLFDHVLCTAWRSRRLLGSQPLSSQIDESATAMVRSGHQPAPTHNIPVHFQPEALNHGKMYGYHHCTCKQNDFD